ncbi:MAG: hypothetical protein LRY54_02630 [Alphaproteobacteria bacterium]|nr:hypothetical protein [Alphaproteobacteria bacterium]
MSLKEKIPGIVVGGLALCAVVVVFNELDKADQATTKKNALCEEFSATHKDWIKQYANLDSYGRSVFKHPAGHICHIYPAP